MKCKSTKDERFDSIYRSCALDVYHACLHFTNDDNLAEEVTQQAFVNFYERLDKMGPDWEPQHLKAYLIHSAKNLACNYYRSANREVPDIDEEDAEDAPRLARPGEIVESAEDSYFREREKALAKKLSDDILADLKESHESWYDVFHMMYYSDKTHDEISEELGITKDVLYSRLHRAKRWIHKNYKEKFDDTTGSV